MCTIIAKGKLIGKNYDSIVKQGMLFTNKRGFMKRGAIFPPERPLEWVSVYGSITFSQSGKEFPASGINEKGLVVEQATLLTTKYPENQEKPAASSLEATQYLLDTCSTVEEALCALEGIVITRTSWPIHFALFDRSGNCSAVEYLNGEMQVHERTGMQEFELTNKEYLDSYADLVGGREEGMDFKTVEEVFQALKHSRRTDTVWSNVYDLEEMTLSICANQSADPVTINLNTLDFAPQSQNLMLRILSNDKDMVPFRDEENRQLISSFFNHREILKGMDLKDPEAMIDFVANQAKNYDMVNEIVIRFLDGERIKQLPVKESHLQYLLNYLASKFQRGQDYSESQVNDIIDRWHTFGDYFILRRSLVDHRLLKRLPNGAKYWRE